VALLWGERAPSVGHTCREAIDEEFGPFDIGPSRRRGGIDSS